jgi:hypothetical protein
MYSLHRRWMDCGVSGVYLDSSCLCLRDTESPVYSPLVGLGVLVGPASRQELPLKP